MTFISGGLGSPTEAHTPLLHSIVETIMTLIKACGYIRMSTPDQKDSPNVQKKEIIAYAARSGFEIIQWYVDEGRSGSKQTQKRTEWLRLLAEAPVAEWKVVLIFSRSRFSRLNSIEEGSAKQKLIEAKKTLHCVVEGPVDWKTSTGRVMDAIRVEEGHEYSRRLGPLVLRGKRDRFLEGKPFGKKCPYGMARLAIDPKEEERLITRKEQFFVPKGWTFKLIPGDSKEVETVRWLFETFITKDVGFRWLAHELNTKGIPSPRGRLWNNIIVRRILANETYVGDTRFGKQQTGKFAFLEGEEIAEGDGEERVVPGKGILRQGTHEGLIDRAMWDQAQEKLKRLKGMASRRSPRGDGGFALTGVLVCGHCGRTMFGKKGGGRKKGGHTLYVCASGQRYAGASGCAQWTVKEKNILPFVINKVVEQIDDKLLKPSSVQEPRPRRKSAKEEVDGLKGKKQELDRMIEDGWDQWGRRSELRRGLEIKLEAWEKERKVLEQQIEQAALAPPKVEQELLDFQRWLDAAKTDLIQLQESPEEGTALEDGRQFTRAGFREVLQKYGFRITCWWEKAKDDSCYPVKWELKRMRLEVGVKKVAENSGNHEENGESDAAQSATNISMMVADCAALPPLYFTGTEVMGRPTTAVILAEMRELHEKGKSQQEIADHLNQKNWPTTHGLPWTEKRVSRIVGRARKKEARRAHQPRSKW